MSHCHDTKRNIKIRTINTEAKHSHKYVLLFALFYPLYLLEDLSLNSNSPTIFSLLHTSCCGDIAGYCWCDSAAAAASQLRFLQKQLPRLHRGKRPEEEKKKNTVVVFDPAGSS